MAANWKNLLFIIFTASFFCSCTYYIGPNRWASSFPKKSYDLPQNKSLSLPEEAILSILRDDLENYAKGNIIEYSNKFSDTILNPRRIFANLILEQKVAEINATILRFEAWGTTGTSSLVNKEGDYDFSEIIWIHIAWYFKKRPDLLYPETAQFILDKYIIDNGAKPTLRAPNTMGIVRETENHVLMKETSRYLKNQWLFLENPDQLELDNSKNGMEAFLIEHLEEMVKTGFYEFNANPYISYTIEAIQVLHSHSSSSEIVDLTRRILDGENLQYALGSYDLKKYSPFRRRMEKANVQDLDKDRHGVLIRMELAKYHQKSILNYPLPCCFDRTIISAFSPYKLPKYIVEILEEKPNSYYAKIGHGIKSTPEIYYGKSTYLLSAGGLRFGKKSQIVPRPITLFLEDDAQQIQDCFHIPGKGRLNQWNNTGVYVNFAVGNHPVVIPNQYKIYETIGDWQVYKIYDNNPIYVCVYNGENLGILYISSTSEYKEVLEINNQFLQLKSSFIFPTKEKITYKINTKKKWVFTSIMGEKLERKFGKWLRFDWEFSEEEL